MLRKYQAICARRKHEAALPLGSMVRPNRPQLALLRGKRGPEVLEAWTREFAGGNRRLAEQYALALARFLGRPPEVEGEFEAFIGTYSPRTRRAYAFAITEFFEWLASEHGRIVPPHEVTTLDAERYVQWLAEKPYSLRDEKLRDGDEPVRLALYETVEQLGSADLASIAAAIPAWLRERHQGKSLEWLHHELGRMVLHDLLVRTPTIEQLRRENPRLGIDEFFVEVPQPDGPPRAVAIENIFSYTVPAPRAVSRKTIADRLTALSSFWDVLMQGENVGGAEAICRYNVFKPIKKQVARGLSAERREAAARANQLTPALVEQLLSAADGATLADKRNAALLWFLVLTGTRVSEAVAIRRGKPPGAEENRWPGWLDAAGEPPGVWVRRKGNKLQWLPYPPYALRALGAFQASLEEHAARRGAQPFEPDAPGYLHADSPKWRYRLLADENDAPLFPPVNFWGANSTHNYQELKPNLPNTKGATAYTRPMTRHGVEKLLKRIAKKAGLSAEDHAKVHAHAIRHFAATAMVVQGKPLREVQAILGHESITTTERYVAEERRPVALSGQNEILDYIAGARPPEGVQPPAPRQPLAVFPKQVIETYGVTAETPTEAPRERPAPPGRRPRKPPRPRLPPPAPPAAAVPLPLEIAEAVADVEAPEETLLPPTSPVISEPAVTLHDTADGTVIELSGQDAPPEATEIRDGISPGSPFDMYDALESDVIGALPAGTIEFTATVERKSAPRKGLAAIEKRRSVEMVQMNEWLAEHYDPWPIWYGISRGALLPWFSRRSAANGVVAVTVPDPTTKGVVEVLMPPLPVLSPDQVYPETLPSGPRRRLFDTLERLSREYAQTQPTKLFGLRRWYATFATMTARLESLTNERYNWVPFESKAKVGEDLRAHDDDYLGKWFEQNAGRWSAARRVFKEAITPEAAAKKSDEDFREFFNMISLRAAGAEDIPAWFVSDDPVREIYDRSPEEWAEFVRWIGSITGVDMTEERREQREIQKGFAEEDLDAKRDEARVLLETYFQYVGIIGKPGGDPEEKRRLRPGIASLTEQLATLGVPDPKDFDKPRKIAQRIEVILDVAFPEGGAVELRDPNVLRSEVFDADALRIDQRAKTLKHTAEFKRRFARRYGEVQAQVADMVVAEAQERFGPGASSREYEAFVCARQAELMLQLGEPLSLDSECLMRRAARGMWEFARGRLEAGKKPDVRMLYAIMLQYIAMIFPCPDEIEKALRKHKDVAAVDETLKFEWLAQMNRQIRALQRGEDTLEDLPPEHRQAAAIAAVMQSSQGVDERTAGKALVSELRAASMTVCAIGGEKSEVSVEKARQVAELLGDPKTRRLTDAQIAKRAKVDEGYVAKMRERVGVVKRVKPPKEPLPPIEREEPSPVAVKSAKAGPRRVVMVEADEPPPSTFFGGVEDESDLEPNAPPMVYLSARCMGRCMTYMVNAERLLPSPLQAIAAMTIAY